MGIVHDSRQKYQVIGRVNHEPGSTVPQADVADNLIGIVTEALEAHTDDYEIIEVTASPQILPEYKVTGKVYHNLGSTVTKEQVRANLSSIVLAALTEHADDYEVIEVTANALLR